MLMHRLLIAAAERRPEKLAFRWVDRDRSLSYAQAVEAMENMAGALSSLGVAKGDRVTIFAHNGLDYLVAMLGAWRIGAVAAAVNVRFAPELEFYLTDHTPNAIVYTHDMGKAVCRASSQLASKPRLICMDGPQDGAVSMPQILEASLTPPPDPGDEAGILYIRHDG
jgi:long-chain acyl-CoA synthetase